MASSRIIRPVLFGGFTQPCGIKQPRQLVVGRHKTGGGTTCSRLNGMRQSRPQSNSPVPFNRRGVQVQKLHTLSTANQDISVYGTIRDVPINAFSTQDSRWTAAYDKPSLSVSEIKLVSWNVDFMAMNAADRVSCILDYLRTAIVTDQSQPIVILLQELRRESFEEVIENSWVRDHFAMVPPNTGYWPGMCTYGLATLVSHQIPVESVQTLHFSETRMGRAALFVDVPLQIADASAKDGGEESATIRIANTHLESLAEGERARPVQLRAIAAMLRQPGVYAGLVGGDMNMILPADQGIHLATGLQDAGADGPEANTWGYQSKRRYPAKRMDRVFYTPDQGLVVGPVEVIGKGLKTERGQWASDHYAIQTTVALRQKDKS